MSTTPAHISEALTAVEFAMNIVHPETRNHARRFHSGFLTARDINTDAIAAHWETIANQWTQD